MSDYKQDQLSVSEGDMAPACISAISETDSFCDDLNLPGTPYQLHVFPLYTEFVDPESIKPAAKAENLKYEISHDVPILTCRKRQQKKESLIYQKHETPEFYEKRIYPTPHNKSSSNNVSKRGQIKGMSKKSSIRLRKRAARIEDLSLWIDLTFADDVMVNKSITERAEFSYYCLKRLTKYVKDKFGLHLIWKREWQDRKSGKNIGEIISHFHVLFGGMSPKQHKNWVSICCQILIRWVEITGTDNENALVVAINKKSYRRIENPKHATCYISKYFSKDEPLDIPPGESIGRCWGKSKNCPDAVPWIISLTDRETVKLIRHMIRKKKLKSKKGKFIRNQLHKRYSTFLFEDEVEIGRYLNFIGVFDEVPF